MREIVSVLVVMAACSKGGGTESAASGASSSDGFVVSDRAAVRINGMGGDEVLIYVASVPDLCTLFQTGNPPVTRDYDLVTFELHDFKGTLAAGKKDLGPGPMTPTHGTATYLGTRKCNTRYGGGGTGTLDVTALDDHHVAASYTLTFASGFPYPNKQLSGTVDVPFCTLEPTKLAMITCK